jgi:flavin-dependent dehydrogenase
MCSPVYHNHAEAAKNTLVRDRRKRWFFKLQESAIYIKDDMQDLTPASVSKNILTKRQWRHYYLLIGKTGLISLEIAVREKKTGTIALHYDCLVVGAGPAGAAAARFLAKSGLRVLVVERRKLPRYKICSGLIMQRSQHLVEESFGSPPEEVFCRPGRIKGARICPAGDALQDAPVEKRLTWNVWRSTFDYWLIHQSGAEVWDGHGLTGLRQTGTTIQADIVKPDKGLVHVDASYVIGADGGRSRIRRLLDPAFDQQIRWTVFVQAYCFGTINLDKEYFYMFFDPSLKSFYTWLNFKDDYLVYGVGVPSGESPGAYFESSTQYLKRTFALEVKKIVRKTACMATDMGISSNFFLGSNRVLLAGEAAGFMNMFGEGISSALATGRIAAEAVYEAATSGVDVLPTYTRLAEPERRHTIESWKLATMLPGLNFRKRGSKEMNHE